MSLKLRKPLAILLAIAFAWSGCPSPTLVC